jgi:DNA-binding response OmpR family regulator
MSVEPFKVMVMGDVAPARQTLIAFLRAGGFEVENGDDADQVMDAISQREFDLDLLDIETLSGIIVAEYCHQIRAIGKPIGILVITGVQVDKPGFGHIEVTPL